MYSLRPPNVYVLERALADGRSARRVGAMLDALGCRSRAEVVSDADIPEMVRANGWEDSRRRQGLHPSHADPALVFATLRFEETPPVAPVLAECPPGTSHGLVANLLGAGGRNTHRERPQHGRVCRARYQYDTLYGCPHGCRYCGGGRVAVVMTNLEELLEKQIAPTVAENPAQKVFMFNSGLSDTLCFEPEYGLSRLMAEFFAGTDDRYYLIHTKSANVDRLLDLEHRGHTIVVWSLTSPSVSRVVEPGSGTTEERIEAARRAQEAGYPVRYKLKPIIPVRGWRQEMRETIALAFARTRPDNIGMCTIAWMSGAEVEACLGADLLDPEALSAMRDSAEAMQGVHTGPLPPALRAAIYGFCIEEIRRHDQTVPIFLSTETPEMWRLLAPRLGAGPADYVCACGPQCTPGLTRLPSLWQPAEAA